MNKLDLLYKIKDLQGLSNDEKAVLINLVNTTKKYGLVWEDKPEDVEEELLTKLPVLIEDKDKFIEAKPPKNKKDLFEGEIPKAPNHILIEGENLHALTALTFTHEGKVDIMYFDPPYNTGNKDFKYNDSFVDKEDSYRHSKWLSFMSKRLAIAKRLLKDTGVIFISIDDNELAQLKMLCDEIFLEQNFIEYFSWTKTSTPPGLSKKTRRTVEYILCYEHKRNNIKYQGDKIDGADAPLLNSGNKLRDLLFPKDKVVFKVEDGNYKKGVYDRIELKTNIKIKDGRADKDFILAGEFKWTQDTVNDEIFKGTYFLVKTERFAIRFQRVESEAFKSPTNQIKESISSPAINEKEQGVETNEQASSEIIDILGRPFFDYPKPVSLIKYFINFFDRKDLTVLDIFAGSGTTLHATMQLNAEDGGTRQCILVTNNENNIAEEICYERNKRVIKGYKKTNGEKVEGITNNNLRYFKTSFVGREKTTKNKKEITQLATELLCIKEDCYNEIKAPKNIRLFEENQKRLMVVYDDNVIPKAINVINSLSFGEGWGEVKVYVFSEGQDPYTEDFHGAP
ncbi:MAG: site-specific DNA-methyltransferase [Bacteroidota bacterium]